ncbi:MAG TPA: phenylalanine--tRNA ligase subunit beta [Polyangium sp.]|nr:phenylalanine--tRNA ligase subunit beta [Polyangium sp.]
MKASYRWIRELIPGLDASPEEIGRRLTHAGIEVEAITEFGEGTKTLVVAEVKAYEPHPSRAKLKLVTINRGGAEQRIVCGAPNVPEPGGLVAFAPLGAHLPAVNMTLTPREIGGVVSEGMLCSERELGLSAIASKDEDAGILILPKGLAAPGTPLREAMPEVHDYILHLGLTPNRPDALGHIGLAREIAALFNLPWKKPTPKAPARFAEGETVSRHVSVRIDDTERCPRYGAGLVLGVTIGPSPTWVRYRLESLGVRSISNVVDVTNLVLLEYGQPMHAFDLNDVRGNQILVRRAAPSEPLKTLDGEDRKLDADDLVIADAEGPTALAGIMGGANSEIHANTTRVLLECAYFTPRGVRRTARRHGMHTESSHRFERGVDHGSLEDALAYATTLLTELAGGAAAREPILAGTKIPAREPVRLRAARMNALLGTNVPLPEATDILTRLGFEVRGTHGEGEQAYADVLPPSHRPDIAGEADLVEEVVRVRGLGTVPTVLPALRPQPPRHAFDLSLRVRGAAVSVGLSEAITYGFVSPEEIEALGLPPAPFRLLNPLTQDRSVMRTSLLPGLLEAVRRARRHGVPDVRLFTVGARGIGEEPRAARRRGPLVRRGARRLPPLAAAKAGRGRRVRREGRGPRDRRARHPRKGRRRAPARSDARAVPAPARGRADPREGAHRRRVRRPAPRRRRQARPRWLRGHRGARSPRPRRGRRGAPAVPPNPDPARRDARHRARRLGRGRGGRGRHGHPRGRRRALRVRGGLRPLPRRQHPRGPPLPRLPRRLPRPACCDRPRASAHPHRRGSRPATQVRRRDRPRPLRRHAPRLSSVPLPCSTSTKFPPRYADGCLFACGRSVPAP